MILLVMVARRVMYYLMVMGPFALMAYIGILARFSTDGYTFVEYGPDLNQRLLDYAPIVQETREKLPRRIGSHTPEARTLAQKWIELAEQGVLKPLPPVYAEDSVREGLKWQAMEAKTLVLSRLHALASSEAKAGNPDQAVADLVLALQLAEVLKYSDFIAVGLCTIDQRRSLGALRDLEIENPEVRIRVREQLVALRQNQQPLDRLAALTRRNEADKRMREGREPIPIEQSRRMVAVRYMLSREAPSHAVMSVLANSMTESRSEDLQFFSEVRLGYGSQATFVNHLDRYLERL
jgi:hypothetical protein